MVKLKEREKVLDGDKKTGNIDSPPNSTPLL